MSWLQHLVQRSLLYNSIFSKRKDRMNKKRCRNWRCPPRGSTELHFYSLINVFSLLVPSLVPLLGCSISCGAALL